MTPTHVTRRLRVSSRVPDPRTGPLFSDFFKNLESTWVSKLYWTKMAIPVVDFSAMSLQNNNQPWAENSNAVKDLAEQIANNYCDYRDGI